MSSRTECRIREVAFADAAEALRTIRETVFVDEQGVPLELEWDGLDGGAVHVLAESAAGEPIGTARLLPDGHIGRMAVLRPWRGQGIGSALLRRLMEIAGGRGLPQVHLCAQVHAIGFYERLGFSAEGPEFLDAGIAHRHMTGPPHSR